LLTERTDTEQGQQRSATKAAMKLHAAVFSGRIAGTPARAWRPTAPQNKGLLSSLAVVRSCQTVTRFALTLRDRLGAVRQQRPAGNGRRSHAQPASRDVTGSGESRCRTGSNPTRP
jgi:hypothetical protein